MRVTRKPLAGKKYLLSKKVISKPSLKILEVSTRIMINLSNFNINNQCMFNAYLKLLLSLFLFTIVKSGKSFVKIGSRLQKSLFFILSKSPHTLI